MIVIGALLLKDVFLLVPHTTPHCYRKDTASRTSRSATMDFKKDSGDEVLVTKQKWNKVSVLVLIILALCIIVCVHLMSLVFINHAYRVYLDTLCSIW